MKPFLSGMTSFSGRKAAPLVLFCGVLLQCAARCDTDGEGACGGILVPDLIVFVENEAGEQLCVATVLLLDNEEVKQQLSNVPWWTATSTECAYEGGDSKTGPFQLSVSSSGYQTKKVDNVTLAPQHPKCKWRKTATTRVDVTLTASP
ncbi:MAG: hypothetical protein HUU55_24135 [Myxococcales bacterium]|nr:hypothetical protein [Myxococcales bacterium]